jgi:hypothetical protein
VILLFGGFIDWAAGRFQFFLLLSALHALPWQTDSG